MSDLIIVDITENENPNKNIALAGTRNNEMIGISINHSGLINHDPNEINKLIIIQIFQNLFFLLTCLTNNCIKNKPKTIPPK